MRRGILVKTLSVLLETAVLPESPPPGGSSASGKSEGGGAHLVLREWDHVPPLAVESVGAPVQRVLAVVDGHVVRLTLEAAGARGDETRCDSGGKAVAIQIVDEL